VKKSGRGSGSLQEKLRFRTTQDIIDAAYTGLLPDRIMITVHPQRWGDSFVTWIWELVFQNVKNLGKKAVVFRDQKPEVRSQRSESRRSKMKINSAKDLNVYKKAYALAMKIFEISKTFPKEERYALTNQIRRSSRSVCLNLREAWAKRRYEAHFISKLIPTSRDDGENSETNSSLDFAKDCSYISIEVHKLLNAQTIEIGKMLGSMINNPESFLIHSAQYKS